MPELTRFAKFSWGVLVLNLGVIVWGAYVRASGSGAGCGSHWPLCNGTVIPRAEQVETLIEFTHRVTSGLALLLVLGLLIWARRIYPVGHRVRFGAGLAMLFMVTESLAGASLVLFGWVAGNLSVARVVVMAIHLANTHLLIASIVLTAWWSSGGAAIRWTTRPRLAALLGLSLIGVLVMSMAGAVTALGDTLFPSATLAEGLQRDFSPVEHFLVRLRVWHPLLAVLAGAYVVAIARATPSIDRAATWLRWGLTGLYVLQLAAGVANLLLLVPVWMQLIHLFLADLVWLALVLYTCVMLREDPQPTSVGVKAVTPSATNPVAL